MSKSAKVRAAEVCRKLGLPVIDDESGVAYQIILRALQKHEQDTRHACAEAIKGIPDHRICKATIEFACMNAKVE